MKIVFVETEEDEREYFVDNLPGHDVEFVDTLDDVPGDAEIVSVFVSSRVGAPFFRSHPRLRLVATRASAADHLDLKAAARHGVILTHVPDYGGATVAEHTFALILGVTRRLRQSLEDGKRRRRAVERLRGIELHGKTLGVIGTGRVGRLVIRIAEAFGMRCLAFDAHPDEALASSANFEYTTLDRILRQADIITLHVPLTPRTRQMLTAKRLARCKRGVILINTARGALVDMDALLEGLRSGQIGGVGLDVLEDDTAFRAEPSHIIGAQIVQKIHAMTTPGGVEARKQERLRELQGIMRNRELLAHENVFFTPHTGFNSVEAIERINTGTVRDIKDFVAGRLAAESIVTP